MAFLLGSNSDSLEDFRRGLRDNGLVEGRDLTLEVRLGNGDIGAIRAGADDLASGRYDIYVVSTATATREILQRIKTAPVVFFNVSDPVGNSFVPNVAKPGGNATGFSLYPYELGGKWLQLLKEAAPATRRVVAVMSPNNPNSAGWRRALEDAAARMKLEFSWAGPRTTEELESALATAARTPNTATLALADPFLSTPERIEIVDRYWRRLPGVTSIARGAERGALVSFEVDRHENSRRSAGYVARILRGEKAGDLPVQSPVTYRLTLNQGTAKALKLQLPTSLLAQADTLID